MYEVKRLPKFSESETVTRVSVTNLSDIDGLGGDIAINIVIDVAARPEAAGYNVTVTYSRPPGTLSYQAYDKDVHVRVPMSYTRSAGPGFATARLEVKKILEDAVGQAKLAIAEFRDDIAAVDAKHDELCRLRTALWEEALYL